MDASSTTDDASPAGLAEPTFRHPASPMLLAEARAMMADDEKSGYHERQGAGTLCDAILVLERRAGGVPTWTDPLAGEWLAEAADRIEGGPFKAVLPDIERQLRGWGDAPDLAPVGARKAVYLTSYGGAIVGNNGKRTAQNLRALAQKCRNGDAGLSAAVYLQNLKRLTKAVSY